MNLRQQLAADLAGRISGSTAAIDRGHGCLMIDNRIFAFTRPDESAALKLPEDRIAGLLYVASLPKDTRRKPAKKSSKKAVKRVTKRR